MSDEEMKHFVEVYRIATVRVVAKLIDESTFFKGLIDVDKSIEHIKSGK